jgi:hypothetical protein
MNFLGNLGRKFINQMLGEGYHISTKEKPSEKLLDSTIKNVNCYIKNLRSELADNFESIKGIHNGKISENDALVALPHSEKSKNILSGFIDKLKKMQPQQREFSYQYLEALDKGIQPKTPDLTKKFVMQFLNEHSLSKDDIGQTNMQLRPHETVERIPITNRLLTHGATALLLFEARKVVKPTLSKLVEKHFEDEKVKVAKRLGKEDEKFLNKEEYWKLTNKEQEIKNKSTKKREGSFQDIIITKRSKKILERECRAIT